MPARFATVMTMHTVPFVLLYDRVLRLPWHVQPVAHLRLQALPRRLPLPVLQARTTLQLLLPHLLVGWCAPLPGMVLRIQTSQVMTCGRKLIAPLPLPLPPHSCKHLWWLTSLLCLPAALCAHCITSHLCQLMEVVVKPVATQKPLSRRQVVSPQPTTPHSTPPSLQSAASQQVRDRCGRRRRCLGWGTEACASHACRFHCELTGGVPFGQQGRGGVPCVGLEGLGGVRRGRVQQVAAHPQAAQGGGHQVPRNRYCCD